MSTSRLQNSRDNLLQAIELVGDAYILHIVSNLALKSMRFCELQRAIHDVNPTTLSSRLKKLEQEKMIVRKKETIDKISVVYELTEKGQGILPAIYELENFAKTYFCDKKIT